MPVHVPPLPSLDGPGHEQKRLAAIEVRVNRIDELSAKGLTKGTPEDAEEVTALLGEIQVLQDREVQNPMKWSFPGGRSASSATSPSRFKAGRWSDPLIRKLERDDPHSGRKALLSGSITVPSLTGGIVPVAPGDRATSLTQVIPNTTLRGTDTFRYLQETTRTNNAAEVAASALKATSIYTVQKVDDVVRTIAHLSQPINRFDLEDNDLLRAYVDGSLAAGVLQRLDTQILSGNGTAPNLRGLANTVGIQTQTSALILQTARKALTKLQVGAERYGGVYVVSPGIWEVIELAQEADGTFVNESAPVDLMRQRLWGQPTIVTNALSGANPTCFLFAPEDTRLYERDAVTVDWSEAPVGSVAGEAAFKTNELIFRAEGRYGFAVGRPASVVSWATI